MDRSVLLVNEFHRSKGHPGMQCQVQMWFEGRIDQERLLRTLRATLRTFPVLTGRLVRTLRFSNIYWQFPNPSPDPLRVEELPDDEERTVLDRAGAAFVPIDLERDPPLRLILLRRPTVGDVLLLQFSHVLMDGKAPELLLKEMSSIDRGGSAEVRDTRDSDELDDWYSDQPIACRIRAKIQRSIRICKRFRARSSARVRIANPDAPRWGREPVSILCRSLDSERSGRLRQRARESVGFEHLVPALLASLWRAVDRQLEWDDRQDAVFHASTPISLRPFSQRRVPLICNFSSYLEISASRSELGDRSALCRALSGRIRARLRDGFEVSVVDAFRWFGRRDDRLRRWLVERFWNPSTLGFAYNGRAPLELAEMFGSRVSRFYTLAPVMSTGVLTVTDLDGIHLGLTYTPDVVSNDVARDLMDAFVDDLTR